MLCFPTMLVSAAEAAGIKIPPSMQQIDEGEYDKSDYPHWTLLCSTQLNRPMTPGEHFENAKIIGTMNEQRVKTITVQECVELHIYREE